MRAVVLDRRMFRHVCEGGIPPDVFETRCRMISFSISGNDDCCTSALNNDGVTLSSKEQSVRRSWKDQCFSMCCPKTFVPALIAEVMVMLSSMEQCARMSWKDVCFTMCSKEESLQMPCTHCLECDLLHFWERRLFQQSFK